MAFFQITTELAPIAKVGGLGDVVYALSKALLREGKPVKVLLPYYSFLNKKRLTPLKEVYKTKLRLSDKSFFEATFFSTYFEDIPLILVHSDDPQKAFSRDSIYGQPDDPYRFLLFLFLVHHYFTNVEKPTLIHLHDWPTAFLAFLYKSHLTTHSPDDPKIILNIHNALHQGRCSRKFFDLLGFDSELLLANPCLQDPDTPTLINLLKSGLCYADALVAVSPTYAKEIQTEEFGYSLAPTFCKYSQKLFGITNGIDLSYFDPAKDHALKKPFPSSFEIKSVLSAKEENKRQLQKTLHFQESNNSPLFAVISRIDEQKGPRLIAHAIDYLMQKDAQFFLLGKPTDPSLESLFYSLEEKHKHTKRFRFHPHFDEDLARLTYASADFILLPSHFEPCGLTQMIGMRYYTIPIARKTGGFADTIIDIDDPHAKEVDKTGILFSSKNYSDLEHALERALALFHNQKRKEDILFHHSLQDFSWKNSLKAYLKIYGK